MDRRSFLHGLAGLTSGLMLTGADLASGPQSASDRLGELLPRRTLGRTGEAVTMLGVGGFHIGRMDDRDAQATIEAALEGGVRFFDSAESYQGGGSERTLGRFLTPKYRDVVFLMTKTTARDAETARRHLEGSLRRLDTDYLDLWQVHSISSPNDVDRRIENGVVEVARKAREEGKVRHLGFTGHRTPRAHAHMLEVADFYETVQMPINIADPTPEEKSFILNVLPEAVDRNVGVLAMKTLSNGGFFGGRRHGEHGPHERIVPQRASIEEALHFAWSLPVSVLITGPDDVDQMKQKIALARSFQGMSEEERADLIDRAAEVAEAVEFYKA